MKKKIINIEKRIDTEHILIPVAWLKRLIEMAQEFKSYDKQHFVGYIESAQWLIDTAKRIDPNI